MKNEPESILTPKHYGKIVLKLDEIRKSHNLSKNKLGKMMGVSYNILSRYCSDIDFHLVDFDFLARACYVFQCDINDFVEYHRGDLS